MCLRSDAGRLPVSILFRVAYNAKWLNYGLTFNLWASAPSHTWLRP